MELQSSLKHLTRRLLANARDFVYPPLCVVCDQPLAAGDPWFCRGCLDKLRRNHDTRDACPRCGENRTRRECPCDLVWDHPYERIYALFDFDDTVQAIAHHVKYRGRSRLARHVAEAHAPLIPPEVLDGVEVVTPIPLHFLRRMKRGYNQAEVIARGMLAGLEPPLPLDTTILKRRKHTRTQTKLNRKQRRRNLAGAFAVVPRNAERIRGKTVVLVDDVVTTGSTTGLCAEMLLEAGAREVRVVALARG